MAQFSKGDFLWLEPTGKSRLVCAVGARVLEVEDSRFRVIDDFSQNK
ncbi:unnamed protein product [Brugia timori]|uniref:DUF4242 domain-containing protein n=1 Tax=Brugia timori TaxID=42155 RepID=A0A0R3QH32_9BILA|nr:unnamed protein product [Brugia timori]